MIDFMRLMTLPHLKTFIVGRAQHARAVAKWAAILIPMSACTGSLCALFLWSLDLVTEMRFSHPELLFGLPLAGLAVGLLYHHFGRDAEAGNNLILEQLHAPGDGAPLRMAPLILISTVTTHLFGGSAGREGTAVQMGGSIASAFAKLFRFGQDSARLLLMAGVAAGFGAVFGTPVAGAVFALEFITLGRLQYDGLIPCLAAAIFGDLFCKAWGVHHVAYHVAAVSGGAGAPLLLAKAALAGVAFGLTSLLFSEAQHRTSAAFKAAIPYAPLRPFVGGLMVIGLAYAFHGQAYLGLGVVAPSPAAPSIVHFFSSQTPDDVSWLWKILFTVVTLGSGFKGGEVTPLFFIGAALGAALSFMLGAPTDLFAALGFVAVFAGASNTPIACSLMGVELFGGDVALPVAVACFTAYMTSGHTGIYLSQRLGAAKSGQYRLAVGQSLRQLRTAVPVKPTAEAP